MPHPTKRTVRATPTRRSSGTPKTQAQAAAAEGCIAAAGCAATGAAADTACFAATGADSAAAAAAGASPAATCAAAAEAAPPAAGVPAPTAAAPAAGTSPAPTPPTMLSVDIAPAATPPVPTAAAPPRGAAPPAGTDTTCATAECPRLQRLDAFRQRFQRQIGIGPHHAREGDLEGQARVRGRLQLRRHVAQHAEHAGQTVGAEQRQLVGQLAPHRFAHFQRHVVAGQRQHVHVAHVLGQIAHELRQVGAGFHVLRRPAEARGHVARPDGAHDGGQVAGIQRPQQALGNLHGHLALAECYQLLQRGERIAHAAFPPGER